MINYIKKILGFIYFLISYFGSSLFIIAVNGFNLEKARPDLIRNVSSQSQFAIKVLGIKIDLKHFEKLHGKNYLIVCNHLSYLDIFVISSFIPTAFVTSNEMKETPFLGQVCILGGCLFVERRSKKGIRDEINHLARCLKEGMNVVIFPEAKSGNGEELLKFRSSLYQAAIVADVPVIPFCLNYKKINNEAVTLKNRDKIFWYGEMTFFPHFLSLLKIKSIEVELNIFSSIKSQDKVELLNDTYTKINENFKAVTRLP